MRQKFGGDLAVIGQANLRIMQLGSTNGVGGIAVVIKELCRSLRDLGCEVILLGNGGEGLQTLQANGVIYHEVKWSRKARGIVANCRAVRQIMRKYCPDIVHVHARVPALACRTSLRMPDFFSIHSTGINERVGMLDRGWLRKYLSPTAKNIVTLTPEARDWALRNLASTPERVHVIPNGVDENKYRPPSEGERRESRERLGLRRGETAVMFLGRFHPRKQPEAVVGLAAAVKRQRLNSARFFLIGRGRLEGALRRRIADEGVEDICEMRDWMDPLDAYWAADLIVMPSLIEGFGLVGAEAMMTGCPVLRSRTGGFDEMVVEGVTGFGCDTTEGDFVDKGIEVLANAAQLRGMRSAAREHASQHLTLGAQARRHLDLYHAWAACR